MAEECSGPVTGLDEIVTGNYGRVVTTMKTEWEFVFDPDPGRSYPGSDLYVPDSGNPGKIIRVGEPMLDANGKPLLDDEGNPKFWPIRVGKPMLDANGKPLLDDEGNPKFWPGRRPVKLSIFLSHPVAQRAKLLKVCVPI
jgi:hypothetical protein